MVLTDNGEVFARGKNDNGQLGDGTQINHLKFTRVIGIPDKVIHIGAGGSTSLAITAKGEVFTWGWNGHGQLGDGTTLQSLIPNRVLGVPRKAVSIAAGVTHSLVLLENGEVFGWGENNNGQLGDGTQLDRHWPKRAKKIPNKVRGISAGWLHSIAFTDQNEIYVFGTFNYGLDMGLNMGDLKTPQKITGITGKVVSVASSDYHNLVLTDLGDVYSWGDNENYQFNDGTKTERILPVKVKGIKGKAAKIAVGWNHSVVLTKAEKIFCWGNQETKQGGQNKEIKVPTLLKEINPLVLEGIFGPGGHLLGFLELEQASRQLLNQEIKL